MILRGSSEPKQLAALVCEFCELVRRINPNYIRNWGISTWFCYLTSNWIDARVLSTLSGVVDDHPCIDRDYFYLCVDFLFAQHCPELFDRGMHRCGLLENVGKRCWAAGQIKKAAEPNSVSFIDWVDCTIKPVESTTNYAHIFGFSYLQSRSYHLCS